MVILLSLCVILCVFWRTSPVTRPNEFVSIVTANLLTSSFSLRSEEFLILVVNTTPSLLVLWPLCTFLFFFKYDNSEIFIGLSLNRVFNYVLIVQYSAAYWLAPWCSAASQAAYSLQCRYGLQVMPSCQCFCAVQCMYWSFLVAQAFIHRIILWHSEDRASWCILITKANEMHYFSSVFDKVLYMFRTCPMSIIRSISTRYTRNKYVC